MKLLIAMLITAGLTFGTPWQLAPETPKRIEVYKSPQKAAPEPWSCDFDDILTWVKSFIPLWR